MSTKVQDVELFAGLPTQFLHDGCHNRAETVCRRLLAAGAEGVGKLWIVPSNLQFGRIRARNPLPIPWLEGASFRLTGVPYDDVVVLHGTFIDWRYHLLAVTQAEDEVTVHDPTTGSIALAKSLAQFEAVSTDRESETQIKVLWRILPHGRALSLADFDDEERNELVRGLDADCAQHPDTWTDYWLNRDKGDSFTVESHVAAANQWHLRLEKILLLAKDLGERSTD